MRKFIGTVLVLLVIMALGIVAYSAEGRSQDTLLGQDYSDAMETVDSGKDVVAAVYNGEEIMMSSVEYQRNTGATMAGTTAGDQPSNREIIDNIVKNMVMTEEAERRGLTATQEEIDEFLNSTVYASYKIPEGKQDIDEYCASAGLTFEEYVETVREQAPRIIEKAKLERAIAQEYCQKHNIELDELNPPQEVRDAIEDFCTDLLEAHRDDITYYVK